MTLRLAILFVLLFLGAAAWGGEGPASPAPGAATKAVTLFGAVQDANCHPRVVGLRTAAQGTGGASAVPPADGWRPVTLPDSWSWLEARRNTTVWYRLDWVLPCEPSQAPVALATQGFSQAGEVYSNGDLLWRDQQLTEPMSRSWNMPRYWVLPASSLKAGENTVWFRLHSVPHLAPGLWETRLGFPEDIHAWYAVQQGLQRSLPMLNIAVTGVLGLIFLFFWMLRRRAGEAGWFAAMALAWNVFMSNFMITSPWPLPDSYAVVRLVMLAFVLYVCAFCLFTWRFAGLRHRRGESALWGLSAVAALVLVFVPPQWLVLAAVASAGLYGGLFIANCLYFQRPAWRSGDVGLRLMAVCLLSFIPIALLDFLSMLRVVAIPFALTPWSAPITATMMAFILAWRFTRHQNQIERFNQDLAATVARTREELTSSLQSRHALALYNVRLEERLQIAHDLHDGMGSTLIRTIAQVEHTQAPPDARHMLSALKSMRDDLRQIIDSGTSEAVAAIETPGQWLAPLRHRFVRLLDALDVASQWQVPATWPVAPSAPQCLALTRFVEEAMTNAIKHAYAGRVDLRLERDADGVGMRLSIEDDGIGFDLDAVLDAGLSVGIHSMRRRIARIGGTLDISSAPGRTRLCVYLGAAAEPTGGARA